jgi:molecular chaperone GrpE (heat shock protein)
MDIDTSTSIPSTSSTDLMKLIDDANRVTAVPETEQWTVRGWLKGMAMFHKNICQSCDKYVVHTVRAYKDKGTNLPRQAIGDAVTTAWPELMRDLERNARERTLDDYKDLEDSVAQLKAELESSQSALASEHSRVERRNETIRDLKDQIEAQMPTVDNVDDVVVDTTWSTSIALRRAFIAPDGPATGTGPIRARSPDISAGVSIPHMCPPSDGSCQQSTEQPRQCHAPAGHINARGLGIRPRMGVGCLRLGTDERPQ